MPTPIIAFPRNFQLWKYSVGHGLLLLRSTKSNLNSTRVDVLFKNVAALNLPTSLSELKITELSAIDEHLVASIGPAQTENRKMFLVSDGKYQGYVIAGVVASHEDDGDYDQPSKFD